MGFRLKNRWAVITGASSGIGLALARELAARGCHLFLTARRESLLREHAEALGKKHKVEVAFAALDLAEAGAASRLLTHLKPYPISILINNAGFARSGLYEKESWPEVSRMIDLNVKFLSEFTLLMLEPLRNFAGPARILNVGSVAGYQGVTNMVPYAATKAFVNHFSEGLNWELRGTNVTVTCMRPGKTASEFFEVAGMTGSKLTRSGVMSSEAVAKQGIRAMIKGKPHVVTGWVNKVMVFSLRLSPRDMVRRVITGMFRDLA